MEKGLEDQKVFLIKAAFKEFLETSKKTSDFNESVLAGDIVIWRDAERTFKTSFAEDSMKDLLIDIIREVKETYHELVIRTVSPNKIILQ
jgi:hypothetical protein